MDSVIGFPRRGIHQEIYPMESSIQLLNSWGQDESRMYQYIKLSMYLHCGCCDNYALIAVSTIRNSRDVAKEKITRFFLLVKPAFYSTASLKFPNVFVSVCNWSWW